MKKFYQKIVEHPKSILTLFILAAVFSLFCQRLVRVNYDIKDYLPENPHLPLLWTKWRRNTKGEFPTPG